MTIKRQRFLPYAFGERRLGLVITSVRTAEETIDLDAIHDPERRELDLRDHAGDTEPVVIGVEVNGADHELLASVLLASEVSDPPVRFVVVAQDEGGWYRATAPLEQAGGGGARGALALVPANSTGTMMVEAIALRTSSAAEPNPRFAAWLGMRLASSPLLTVRTREPVSTPGGALDVRWEHFAESQRPALRRRSERIFYLEVTAEPPVLWLNRSVPDLPAVLESKGTHGQRAVIRELVNRTIALPALYALIHAASVAVTSDEESRPAVPEGWRRGFLAQIAPRLHPGVARETAYERLLEELWAMRHEGEEARAVALIERMVAAIEDELQLADVVRRALKELAR